MCRSRCFGHNENRESCGRKRGYLDASNQTITLPKILSGITEMSAGEEASMTVEYNGATDAKVSINGTPLKNGERTYVSIPDDHKIQIVIVDGGTLKIENPITFNGEPVTGITGATLIVLDNLSLLVVRCALLLVTPINWVLIISKFEIWYKVFGKWYKFLSKKIVFRFMRLYFCKQEMR